MTNKDENLPPLDTALDCPFCGSRPEWNIGRTGDGKPWHYIACENCEAMGDTGSKRLDVNITDWNRRPERPTVAALDNGFIQGCSAREALIPQSKWLPISEAPRDGTRFLGAFYWPSKAAIKRLEKIGGTAEGVTYHYGVATYWHDGKWHIQNHAEVSDQDSLYAWQPIELPQPPEDEVK